ncbi:hypothetical protein ACFL0R_04790 [Pseudomonadota bacterium]
MIPEYWSEFVEKHHLIGRDIEIDEDSDLSELGADLRIMTNEQSMDEATNCYPGITVIKKGYVPVAMCLSGSGDYYYINKNEGRAGAIYRIYHDSVSESSIDEGAIDKVLDNYERLLP